MELHGPRLSGIQWVNIHLIYELKPHDNFNSPHISLVGGKEATTWLGIFQDISLDFWLPLRIYLPAFKEPLIIPFGHNISRVLKFVCYF